jgi:hypothetical protein
MGRLWPLLPGFSAFLFAAVLLLVYPEPAEAVQPHGEPEGLVAHQLGHVLFAGGMLFLLVRSHISRWSGPGWYRFKGFLWLAIAWNILTFVGHFLHLDKKELVTRDGRTVALVADSLSDFLFYLAKLDHLLLLPCLLLLALALKQWMQASEGN